MVISKTPNQITFRPEMPDTGGEGQGKGGPFPYLGLVGVNYALAKGSTPLDPRFGGISTRQTNIICGQPHVRPTRHHEQH